MAILRSAYGSGFVKRLGNVVGQKAGKGKYRISAYQPEVSNPRTEAQQVQRSKFSFLGKMAVVFGEYALLGLKNTKYRTTQLAFITKNMPEVRMMVIGDPTVVDPTLTLSRVMLSDGGVMQPALTVSAAGETKVTLRVDTSYGIVENRPTAVMVAAVCLSEVSRPGYRASVVKLDYSRYVDGIATTDMIELPVDVGDGQVPPTGFPVVVFAYNIQQPLNAVRTRYGNVQSAVVDGEEAFAAVDTVLAMSGREIFSKTTHDLINLR